MSYALPAILCTIAIQVMLLDGAGLERRLRRVSFLSVGSVSLSAGGGAGGLRLYVLALLFGCDVALAASACLEERSVERRDLKES